MYQWGDTCFPHLIFVVDYKVTKKIGFSGGRVCNLVDRILSKPEAMRSEEFFVWCVADI